MIDSNKIPLDDIAKEQYARSSSARVDQAMKRMEQQVREKQNNPGPGVQTNKTKPESK